MKSAQLCSQLRTGFAPLCPYFARHSIFKSKVNRACLPVGLSVQERPHFDRTHTRKRAVVSIEMLVHELDAAGQAWAHHKTIGGPNQSMAHLLEEAQTTVFHLESNTTSIPLFASRTAPLDL